MKSRSRYPSLPALSRALLALGLASLSSVSSLQAQTTETPPPAPAVQTVPDPSAAMSATPTVAPKLPITEQSLKSRAGMINNLVENSSSAKQIESAGTPESKKLREEARQLLIQARAAQEKGNFPEADELLKKATRTFQQAVKQAHPEQLAQEKAKRDYANRRDSVRTMISTNKRVSSEKGNNNSESAKAEALLAEAEKLAAENKHADGLIKLNEAYALVKDSVRSMRSGEELKAEKKFANKAEEYEYEQMRNDDYQNLIPRIGKVNQAAEESAKRGAELRVEADALAKSGDHEGALKKINESTSQLKSVLRAAGLPII